MVYTYEKAVKELKGLPAGMCETFLEWWGRTRRKVVSPSSEIDSLDREQISNQIVKAQVMKDMEKIIIKVWIDVGFDHIMIKIIVQVWVSVGFHHGHDQNNSPGMG